MRYFLLILLTLSVHASTTNYVAVVANVMKGVDNEFKLIDPADLACVTGGLVTNYTPAIYFTRNPLVYGGSTRDSVYVFVAGGLQFVTYATNCADNQQRIVISGSAGDPQALGTYKRYNDPDLGPIWSPTQAPIVGQHKFYILDLGDNTAYIYALFRVDTGDAYYSLSNSIVFPTNVVSYQSIDDAGVIGPQPPYPVYTFYPTNSP